jgi:hypothetical protein
VDDWPGVRAPIGGIRAPAAWGLGAVSLAGLGAAVLTTGPVAAVGAGVAALGAWEAGWWLRRRGRRTTQFALARAEATALGRPLVVIGAPDGGSTAGYPCGDFTVDISGSSCPNTIVADVTKPMPFADDSVVCFIPCVLEYIEDVNAGIAEIERISGGHAFFVSVEWWTLTAYLYPGAKRTLPFGV